MASALVEAATVVTTGALAGVPLAARTGRPTAELVREAVEEYASRHSRVRLPQSLGAGKSRRRDLGTRAESLLHGMGENR